MDITRFPSVVITIVTIFYSVQTRALFGEVQQAMRCVTKLLPCHPYIHSVVPPPPSCCTPMKEIAEKDATCLCAALNHPDMLSFINLTKENALNLLNSCGVKHDASLCANTGSSSSPGSIFSGSSSTRTTKIAALAVSFIGFCFVSAFLG